MPDSDTGEPPLEGAAIDEFLAQCEEEQARLRGQIQLAQQRIERAASGHDELAQIEQEHREAVKAIHDGALAEATRLLDEAQSRAKHLQSMRERFRSQPQGGDRG